MKILFIAPLPPPLGGHSLAAKVFLDDLATAHDVDVINLNRDSMEVGKVTFNRIFEVLNIVMQIWRKRRGIEVIYFTISESLTGNIKDLLIYLICFGSLSKMFIHLHGGSIKRCLFERYRCLMKINRVFVSRCFLLSIG